MNPPQAIIPELEQESRRIAGSPALFDRWHVQPWPAAYVTVDDVILVTVESVSAVSTVNVSIRYQRADGQIIPEFVTITGQSGGTPITKKLTGAEGYILSVSAESPGVVAGLCFVSVELQRGQGSSDTTFGQLLLSGYPGFSNRIGYPQTPALTPQSGFGFVHCIAQGNPAAGAELQVFENAHVIGTVLGVQATLTTAAGGSARWPSLRYEDFQSTFCGYFPAFASVAPASSAIFCWFPGAVAVAGTPQIAGAIPPGLRLFNNAILQSLTQNIAGGDQWSAVSVIVNEWILN